MTPSSAGPAPAWLSPASSPRTALAATSSRERWANHDGPRCPSRPTRPAVTAELRERDRATGSAPVPPIPVAFVTRLHVHQEQAPDDTPTRTPHRRPALRRAERLPLNLLRVA